MVSVRPPTVRRNEEIYLELPCNCAAPEEGNRKGRTPREEGRERRWEGGLDSGRGGGWVEGEEGEDWMEGREGEREGLKGIKEVEG